MNKFLKIENGWAQFQNGRGYTEADCRKQLAEFQAAIEAFRVEKLEEVVKSLSERYTRRSDNSYFVHIPGHPVIFTSNSAGECFVEQGERRVIVSLDESLESLVDAVKEFLKPEPYRILEPGEVVQEGDEGFCRGEWLRYSERNYGRLPQWTTRRPLLPNSITSKNFTLPNNTNQ